MSFFQPQLISAPWLWSFSLRMVRKSGPFVEPSIRWCPAWKDCTKTSCHACVCGRTQVLITPYPLQFPSRRCKKKVTLRVFMCALGLKPQAHRTHPSVVYHIRKFPPTRIIFPQLDKVTWTKRWQCLKILHFRTRLF